MKAGWLLIVLLVTMASCGDGNRCYESVDTLMVTTFSINSFKQINEITVKGFNRNAVGDTILFDTTSSLTKKATLPLSLTKDSTGFVVSINNKVDTVWIKHRMVLTLVSENCGFAPVYSLNGTRLSQGVDSVKITDKLVNPQSIEKQANDQNIIIYFNPAAR